MRLISTVVLSFLAASALAYEVTSPDAQGWTTTGPNVLSWTQAGGDPLNFTAVLTNQNLAITNNQVLAALVDGSLLKIVANPPSGGWPQGPGFQVNLVANADSLNTILAKSVVFAIKPPNVTTSSTTSSSVTYVVPTTPAVITTPVATPTAPAAGSSSNGADSLRAHAGIAGAAALLALYFA